MDYLVKITMTKHMENITVSMTTLYLQLLYEELVNCSQTSSLAQWLCSTQLPEIGLDFQSAGIFATHSKQRCLENKNATVKLHKANKL